MSQLKAPKGLAGVVVDSTCIADVQPQGQLIYRGLPIGELVTRPFAEVAALVVDGRGAASLEARLADAANLTAAESATVLALPERLHPMRVLQGMIPLLQAEGAPREAGLTLAAKLPAVVLTHLHREVVPMSAELDYASRFLQALRPQQALNAEHVEAFNTAQILQIEHSFNAGTFAARVVASTQASVAAAMSAGLGALSGALHGGADQAALEVIDGLADAAAIEAYVDQVIADGGRVPGMGHREYRVRDPRAVFLQDWAERLAADSEHAGTWQRLRLLDDIFRARMADLGKDVHPNIEFYKGLVYRVLGLPDDYFTAGFAMARVFGYVAHYLENARDNRIYRPQATYVGD